MGKDPRMNWFEEHFHWEMLVTVGGLAATGFKGFLHLRDRVLETRRDQALLAERQTKVEAKQDSYIVEMRTDLKEVHTRVTAVANSTARIEGMLAARIEGMLAARHQE